jgi:HK97 family phage prohead protease
MMITRSLDPRIAGALRYATLGCELRAEGETPPKIAGHGAVFDEPTELWPGYKEVIRPGAFAKTLAESDIRGLFNHEPSTILGRTKAGTLELAEDDRGLAYVIDPPPTRTVRDRVLIPMERGDLDGSSFSFSAIKAPETTDESGETLREIVEARLWDVSVVTFPQYPTADAGLRAEIQVRAALQLGRADVSTVAAILEAAGLTAEEFRARMGLGSEIPTGPGPGPVTSPKARGELEILFRRLDLMRREV